MRGHISRANHNAPSALGGQNMTPKKKSDVACADRNDRLFVARIDADRNGGESDRVAAARAAARSGANQVAIFISDKRDLIIFRAQAGFVAA